MPDLKNGLWDFFRPFIRPARIIVLFIVLYFISNINHVELLHVLQNTRLVDKMEVSKFFLEEITVLELITSIFIAFIVNPLLTSIFAKCTSDLLKPLAAPLMSNLYSIWNASKQERLNDEDRLLLFNNYSEARSVFLILREAIELILPFCCLLCMISNDQLVGAISAVVVAFLLFWLCVQRLLVLYLKDIAPYELIRRPHNSL